MKYRENICGPVLHLNDRGQRAKKKASAKNTDAFEWSYGDSNPGPSGCQPDALAN